MLIYGCKFYKSKVSAIDYYYFCNFGFCARPSVAKIADSSSGHALVWREYLNSSGSKVILNDPWTGDTYTVSWVDFVCEDWSDTRPLVGVTAQ